MLYAKLLDYGIKAMPTIKKIEYLRKRTKTRRQLKITLSNKRVIRAEACHESWEQWGGTVDELYITMPIVMRHNDWLHGGSRPEESED